jgi:hypothetical protein
MAESNLSTLPTVGSSLSPARTTHVIVMVAMKKWEKNRRRHGESFATVNFSDQFLKVDAVSQ